MLYPNSLFVHLTGPNEDFMILLFIMVLVTGYFGQIAV